RADAVDAAADSALSGLWRLLGQAEGDHLDEVVQRRVLSVGQRVDPAGGGERAQPVVALLLAGAQEVIALGELGAQRGDAVQRVLDLLIAAAPAALVQP